MGQPRTTETWEIFQALVVEDDIARLDHQLASLLRGGTCRDTCSGTVEIFPLISKPKSGPWTFVSVDLQDTDGRR